MRLKLHFDMDNDAFEGGDAHAVAADVLREVAHNVRRGVTAASIRDFNGNTIGSFVIGSRSRTAEAAAKAAESRKRNLSPERRTEIAKKAAAARWKR